MDYRTKYLNRGFSLIELIIVIAIFSVIASISITSYVDYTSYQNREIAVNSLVQALRFAQSNAQTVEGDSKWGVEILPTQLVIFKGSTYATRASSSDQINGFSGGIVASGLSEVVFEKMVGNTTTVGTTTLTNKAGAKNIQINEKGTITY